MNRFWSGFGVVALIVAIDQVIKYAVETGMGYHEEIRLLPFFSLYRTHNQGIAFSFLWGAGPWVLVTIAVAVIAFVLWLWRSNPDAGWLSHMAFGLIIGGAIGNIIDRALFGYVIDYFLFFVRDWSFAVFNFADAAISIGAVILLFDEFIGQRKTKAVDG